VPETLEIGTQRGSRDGDLIELELHGELTVADVSALKDVVSAVLAAHNACFMLADLRQMSGIAADARRQIIEWSKTHSEHISGAAVYGCSFATRALLTLTLTAIRLFRKQRVEAVFVRDAAAGRAWINARRAELLSAGEASHDVG
jgi:hypothetical protein